MIRYYLFSLLDKRVYLNTERSLYTMYSSSALVQCLRVWYQRPSSTTSSSTLSSLLHARFSSSSQNPPLPAPRPPTSALTNLTHKVFYPLKCKEGGMFEDVQFEPMSETKIRMKQWLKANNRKCCMLNQRYVHKWDAIVCNVQMY